jgi:hypothetical protein
MDDCLAQARVLRDNSKSLGVNPLRLPLIYFAAVDPVLAILSLFLLDAHLAFFALLATVAHDSSSFQCK